MAKAIFTPAIGEQLNSCWRRGLKYKGKYGKEYDLKFFTPQSHFNYDYALQSCYYGIHGVGKKAKGTFRDMIGFPKDKTLLTDSAGYQIASFQRMGKPCDIKPIDSLRWQEENGDIGFNLDYPPTLYKAAEYKHFKWSLKKSVENFDFFEKNRNKGSKISILNVLHGESIILMDEWYQAVKKFNFDGWAIGMKPPWNSMIQALGFLYLWEKGEFKKPDCKALHFFGTSGKWVVPTIVYIASKLPNHIKVSYDSSSYNIGSIYRTYYLPFDFGPTLSFGNKFKLINPGLKTLPCCCPVCRSIKDISILNGTDIFAGTLISLHNLYQYVIYNDLLNSLITANDGQGEVKEEDIVNGREKEEWEEHVLADLPANEEKTEIVESHFRDYLKSINASELTLVSLDFIDFAMEYGLKNAIQRFERHLILQHVEKAVQVNIFYSFKKQDIKKVIEEGVRPTEDINSKEVVVEEEEVKEEKPVTTLEGWGFK